MFAKQRNRSICFFSLVGIALGFLWNCHNGSSENIVPVTSDIMAGNCSFHFQQQAEKKLQELLKSPALAPHFKLDRLNRLNRQTQPVWMGRIRADEVSYNAIFALDDSRIMCQIKCPGAKGMVFSLYHPEGSDLTYNIYIKEKQKEKKVFSKSLKSKTFFNGHVTFDQPLTGETVFIFESQGRGLGAWVTPRLLQKKGNPQVCILLVMDTMRRDHTSAYGYHRKTTPFMEQLAREGVKYENAYSSTSWTLPAHVSLFSGKDLSEHGVVSPDGMIATDYPLLAEVFQKEGFVTAAFTGGGFVEDSYGFHRGFQYYSNAPGNVFSMNSAERVFNHFKNYISNYGGSDMFVFLHTYQIHAPYKAPRQYVDRIDQNVEGNLLGISNFLKQKSQYYQALEEADRQRLIDLYDASILYTDEQLLGQLIGFLKEKDLYENAMIVVLSDHGEEFYEHGSWEHGHTLYNELIKIPLIIKYPKSNGVEPSSLEKRLTSITDIAGLIVQQYGFKDEINAFPVGIGTPHRMLPVLFPESPIIKQFLTKVSFVSEDFHFIFNRIDEAKLSFFNPRPKNPVQYELYRTDDLMETQNVYKEHFRKITELKEPLKQYLEKIKRLKRKNKTLDNQLQEKLKSLGYLGN